jgi:type II secretory pathway component GspD/PulD (secretin)
MNIKPNHAMKKTASILLMVAACLIAAKAQTETTPAAPAAATDTNATVAPAEPAAAVATNSAPAPAADTAVATNSAPTATVTTAPAPESAAATNAPVTTTEAAATNAPAGEATAGGATTPAPAAVGIPQIKFSDVPITTAIENLARLANINYVLDPKIGYGQPDANGQIKAEPTLSIRWENITAENALLALLDNYNLQLVSDKRTGISRITTKDPTAPPPLFTKVVQLKYASTSNMIEAAQSVLTDKRSKVMPDHRTSQIIVVATDPEQTAIETLVAQLDKPTRQVLIETRLIQISSTPSTKKGVDWSGTLQNQNVTFGNGKSLGTFTTTFPGSGTPPTDYNTVGNIMNVVGGGGFSWNTKSGTTPDIGFLNADGLSAVLSFLNQSAEAQVMSTPRVVTLDNEQANISVTRGYPIFNVTAGTANTAGGSSITYSNVGTVLHVTPRISANDYIWLRVLPEVSSFFGNFTQSVPNTGTGGGSSVVTAPIFDSRTMETQVLIPNSNTLVMGGLVQNNPSASYTKVPLLGDVPGLGFFFRSENKSEDRENLLIFITPTIVRDTDFQAAPHASEFLQSKQMPMKAPMHPGTAWDSAQPAGNWSDPISDNNK